MLPLSVGASPELFDTKVQSNWKMIRKALCEPYSAMDRFACGAKQFSRVDLTNHVHKVRVRTMGQIAPDVSLGKDQNAGILRFCTHRFSDSVILKTEAKRTRQSTGP